MRITDIIIIGVIVTLVVAVFILFTGYSPGVTTETNARYLADIETWYHVKSVWLPTLIGILLIIQMPVVISVVLLQLWEFSQEEKHYADRYSPQIEKAKVERASTAEEKFAKYIKALNPELVQALRHEIVMVADCPIGGSTLKEKSAYDFFVDMYHNEIFHVLEKLTPLPEQFREIESNLGRYCSLWISKAEAFTKSALIVTGSIIVSLLGYALVFV